MKAALLVVSEWIGWIFLQGEGDWIYSTAAVNCSLESAVLRI